MGGKAIDETGNRYGKLLVHKRVDKGDGVAWWECRCDCGNVSTVRGHHLRQGDAKSCGCQWTENMRKIRRDQYHEGTQPVQFTGKLPLNNKSGCRGVCWDTRLNKWRCVLYFKKRCYFLGNFEAYDDAVKARRLAEEKYVKPLLEKYCVNTDGK